MHTFEPHITTKLNLSVSSKPNIPLQLSASRTIHTRARARPRSPRWLSSSSSRVCTFPQRYLSPASTLSPPSPPSFRSAGTRTHYSEEERGTLVAHPSRSSDRSAARLCGHLRLAPFAVVIYGCAGVRNYSENRRIGSRARDISAFVSSSLAMGRPDRARACTYIPTYIEVYVRGRFTALPEVRTFFVSDRDYCSQVFLPVLLELGEFSLSYNSFLWWSFSEQ